MMDVVVLLDGRVGRPAKLFRILDEAGISVKGSCVFPRLGGRVAHIAIDDDDLHPVEDLLIEHMGGVADQRPCIVVPAGYPGGRREIGAKILEADIVVSVSYYGENGELFLATSDGARTRQVLGLT